jgi:cell division protein FtsB
MPEAKRPDPKRRSPAPRPGKAGPRKSTTERRARAVPEPVEPVKRAIVASAEQRSEQRLGLTARRAAILAAVVCVLTLTIAGPVRTYFAQRTEMKQLAASEAALRRQIADLEQQKTKLADPAYIAAQARERLGFVMPGEVPYQVQLPPSAAVPAQPGPETPTAASGDFWYTALWHTIADTPHGPPSQAPPAPPSPPPPGG